VTVCVCPSQPPMWPPGCARILAGARELADDRGYLVYVERLLKEALHAELLERPRNAPAAETTTMGIWWHQ
jgi:hypothetical protein